MGSGGSSRHVWYSTLGCVPAQPHLERPGQARHDIKVKPDAIVDGAALRARPALLRVKRATVAAGAGGWLRRRALVGEKRAADAAGTGAWLRRRPIRLQPNALWDAPLQLQGGGGQGERR